MADLGFGGRGWRDLSGTIAKPFFEAHSAERGGGGGGGDWMSSEALQNPYFVGVYCVQKY